MTEHIFTQAANEPLFARRLQAQRSLSAAQFRILVVFLCAASSLVTVPFFLLGAWPIVGFMGLDVVLVIVAFRSNFRAAAAYDEVCLSPNDLFIEKVSARGARRSFHFNPRWVRLEQQEDHDFGVISLQVNFRQQRVALGSFLAPIERERFVKAFRPALAEAQRGPRFALSCHDDSARMS